MTDESAFATVQPDTGSDFEKAADASSAFAKPEKPAAPATPAKKETTQEDYRRSYMQRVAPRLPHITTPEQLRDLEEGAYWVDPDGEMHQKPYAPTDPGEFRQIPEGAAWSDPEGGMHEKPHYEGVGFTAQSLYTMALDDKSKEAALKRVWGDKVKRGPQGLYVDDNGVIRVPDYGGIGSKLGISAAETAPAAGMTFGSLGGPTGTMLGAAAGRTFNNVILAIAGVHQDIGPTVSSAGWEAAGAGGGEMLGKGLSLVPGAIKSTKGAIKGGIEKASEFVTGLSDILENFGVTPESVRKLGGVTPEAAKQAQSITARGGKVPPSVLLPEMPYIKKIEEFDAVFRGRNVFAEAARDFYEQETRKISDEAGVPASKSYTAATARPSSREAGEKVIAAAQRDAAHDDALLEQARREAQRVLREPIEALGGEAAARKIHQEAIAKLAATIEASKGSTDKLIQGAIMDLRANAQQMLEMIKVGENPSALNRMIEEKFRAYNAATRIKLRGFYDAADAATGGVLPDTNSLLAEAKGFYDALPMTVKEKYPGDVKSLARLAEASTAPGSNIPPLTWGELRQMRSWLRHGIDYNDLTPDMRAGSLKYFEKKINAIIHDANAAPELKQAAKLLDTADAAYKELIPPLNDEMVRSTLKALESGHGVNPEKIAHIFFDPERTVAMRKAREIMGENAWKTVEAARIEHMANNAKMLDGSTDATSFAKQIVEDYRNGLLENGYTGKNKTKLLEIAQDVARLEGDLPIDFKPGDTLQTAMQRANAAKTEMERLAKYDPIAAFSKAQKQIDKDAGQALTAAIKTRNNEPLQFLYKPNALHIASADKILDNPDLVIAAANKFERESPEFKALQQVYVARFFQRNVGAIGSMRGELAGEIKGGPGGKSITSEEVQALMFPGVTLGHMHQFAKDMEFLFAGGNVDFGGSMAAAARVLNPTAHIPLPKLGTVGNIIAKFPGISFVSRLALQKMFALTMDAVSHPNFINWLAGELKGTVEQRFAAKAALDNRYRMGGWFGSVVGQQKGEGIAQGLIPEPDEQQETPPQAPTEQRSEVPPPAPQESVIRFDDQGNMQ